jgi:hypothetical protein
LLKARDDLCGRLVILIESDDDERSATIRGGSLLLGTDHMRIPLRAVDESLNLGLIARVGYGYTPRVEDDQDLGFWLVKGIHKLLINTS